MSDNSKGIISEWRPVTDLKQVNENISEYGYSKEFIAEHQLDEIRSRHCSNVITGRVNFFEPLEIKEDKGKVFFRENSHCVYMDDPETFETQHGTFNNHNNGEFISWLGKDDLYIEGNFCDMFDCGEYSYAVSNLMHMGLGSFKVVRIDKALNYEVVYDNSSINERNCLRYAGRFKNDKGIVIIASGFIILENNDSNKRDFQDRTLLIQIDKSGNCNVCQEWSVKLSSSNGMVATSEHIYFGQNKMITRLDLHTGELAFFTNKNDEELADLKKVF